jgi:hypothetical protein
MVREPQQQLAHSSGDHSEDVLDMVRIALRLVYSPTGAGRDKGGRVMMCLVNGVGGRWKEMGHGL